VLFGHRTLWCLFSHVAIKNVDCDVRSFPLQSEVVRNAVQIVYDVCSVEPSESLSLDYTPQSLVVFRLPFTQMSLLFHTQFHITQHDLLIFS